MKLHPSNEVVDADGNVIRRGMMVMSGGDKWVVGYAHRNLVRLDREISQGQKETRIIGQRRFYLIQIIGFQIPLIFQ